MRDGTGAHLYVYGPHAEGGAEAAPLDAGADPTFASLGARVYFATLPAEDTGGTYWLHAVFIVVKCMFDGGVKMGWEEERTNQLYLKVSGLDISKWAQVLLCSFIIPCLFRQAIFSPLSYSCSSVDRMVRIPTSMQNHAHTNNFRPSSPMRQAAKLKPQIAQTAAFSFCMPMAEKY